MNPKKILIIAGEPSGDLHASNLAKDLKGLNPNLEFFGLGGNSSREAGVDVIFDTANLALVGAVEVLKNIFTIRRVYGELVKRIDSTRPDLAILVDYPGFNLRLAKELNARSIPVVYYISPQVWAWWENRIDIIKRHVKKIIVFFKFEKELYERHGVNAEFVGHPLLDIAKATSSKEDTAKRYDLSEDNLTIALLPGSRKQEVGSLLPMMVSACAIIKKKLDKAQFIIAKHKDLPSDLYERATRNSRLDIRIADGETYNVLNIADFAIVASGTATLDCAIIGVPFIIVYKANFLTFILYRLVAKVRFLGLVNIIAGKEAVPEFLQYDATPKKVADKTIEVLRDEEKKAGILKDLESVKSYLGTSGASLRAAKAILPLLC